MSHNLWLIPVSYEASLYAPLDGAVDNLNLLRSKMRETLKVQEFRYIHPHPNWKTYPVFHQNYDFVFDGAKNYFLVKLIPNLSSRKRHKMLPFQLKSGLHGRSAAFYRSLILNWNDHGPDVRRALPSKWSTSMCSEGCLIRTFVCQIEHVEIIWVP